jgi:hypothetical protein
MEELRAVLKSFVDWVVSLSDYQAVGAINLCLAVMYWNSFLLVFGSALSIFLFNRFNLVEKLGLMERFPSLKNLIKIRDASQKYQILIGLCLIIFTMYHHIIYNISVLIN